ncbi:MAG: hypothetical protein ACLP3Q_18260 [Streptosporangiaceae bacterium]
MPGRGSVRRARPRTSSAPRRGNAVAEHGFAACLAEKQIREPGPDPVEDLRAGWDLHIGFGLANPALYSLMYGDPRRRPASGTRSAASRRHWAAP